MVTYTFIKEGSSWYIDLPEYIRQGGKKADLQMVEGADTMLELMAEGGRSLRVSIDRNLFDEADLLVLTQKCDPSIGGGYYRMKTYEGKDIHQTMWLCGVLDFVFGEIPEKIFVKKEKS
ncbi:MAG: DUF6717 family protein [Cytophagaceae bacterium]